MSLTQLQTDAAALAAAIPTLAAAASAVAKDTEDQAHLDLESLETDAPALATAVSAVNNCLAALSLDLDNLPQAKADANAYHACVSAAIAEVAAGNQGGTRLQNLICFGIPIYNVMASLYGLPVIPLPAFCTPTPTPTPTPTK